MSLRNVHAARRMPSMAAPTPKKVGHLASDDSCSIRNEERRAFPRFPVSLPAVCYSKVKQFRCALADLDETGARFRSAEQPQLNETLTLAFSLGKADDEPVSL